jgi:hypothetical protein
MTGLGHMAHMGDRRGAYRVLLGRPEGKRPLGRPRHRLEDNMKVYLKETGWNDVDSIELAQDTDKWRAVVNTVMKFKLVLITNLMHKSFIL